MAFGKPVPDNSMMQPAVPNWSTSLHDPFDPKPVPDVATNRVNRFTARPVDSGLDSASP